MESDKTSLFEGFYNDILELIGSEAGGFGQVIDTLVNFDATGNASTAITVFKAVGAALTTLFLCMEVFSYCSAIDFNGGIEGALKVAMKLVVCQLIVQNVNNISGLVAGLFKGLAKESYSDTFKVIGESFAD